VKDGIAVLAMDDPPAKHLHLRNDGGFGHRDFARAHGRKRSCDPAARSWREIFSAGANISMLAKVDPEFKYYFCLHANETLSRLEQTPSW